MMNRRIRLAVVGGGRGGAFIKQMDVLNDKVELVALCDKREDVLQQWKARSPGLRLFQSYEALLEDPNIDAIILSTPVPLHAQQSIQALKSGKHVLSEVSAASTMEECWELVETVEQTGLTYMMAENSCFMQPMMQLWNMVQHGLFGEITYLEAAYIHETKQITHSADGSMLWRGDMRRFCPGNSYPTHQLGPLALWLGINREGGDRFESLVTFKTDNKALRNYYRDQFGQEHPGASAGYWQQGDSSTTLIRTRNGVVIDLRQDNSSNRPASSHYALQGTNGVYIAPRYSGENALVWLKGRSATGYESLSNYKEEYDHPVWRKGSQNATEAGHGGSDFFVYEEFINAICEGRRPLIDVYDAVTWSCVTPLSVQSVLEDSKNVKFPDFTAGRKSM